MKQSPNEHGERRDGKREGVTSRVPRDSTGLVNYPIRTYGRCNDLPVHLPHESARDLSSEDIAELIYSYISELMARAYHYSAAEIDSASKTQAEVAAKYLVGIGETAAAWSEFLAEKRLDLMKAVARTRTRWPFNLEIRKDKRTGKKVVARLEEARNLLDNLQVGDSANLGFPGFKKADSKFRIAAKQVYFALQMLKEARVPHPEKPGSDIQFFSPVTRPQTAPTEWVRRLEALKYPMTTANAEEWWAVAKMMLDEHWFNEQDAFLPLIELLNLKDRLDPKSITYKPSVARRRVIDDSLKKAFKALADG